MHTAKISVLAVTAAATFVLSAEPSVAAGGPAFGQHVSDCAHTMQYSGTHNPAPIKALRVGTARPACRDLDAPRCRPCPGR